MKPHPDPTSLRNLYEAALAAWHHHPDRTDGERDASVLYAAAEAAIFGLPAPEGGLPGRRHIGWVTHLHAYERFGRGCGRAPRERTRDNTTLPVGERHLGEWARYQRRTRNRLTLFQVCRLDTSPVFSWNPHQDAWETTLTRVRTFTARTGRLPQLNGCDRNEFLLARWLGRQLAHEHDRTLTPTRRRLLHTLLRQASGRR